MRILFVNQYFPPDSSATAYILAELAEDLARDHYVEVIAGRPSYNAEAGDLEPAGINVRRVWSTTFKRAGLPGRIANYITFLLSSSVSVITRPKPDVVVSMTDPPIVGIVGLLAARRHKRPFVYVSHDVFPEIAIAIGRMDHPLMVLITRKLVNLIRREAKQIVVVGRDMLCKLSREGLPEGKLSYVPTWAKSIHTSPRESADVRQEMGWVDRFVVMHAGNIGLAQNLTFVVEAASQLRHRPEILFVFMGDGAAKRQLQEQVLLADLPNVVFLPYRSKNEAQRIIAAADVHLVSLVPGLLGCAAPSKTYGIMAAGRPFIAAVESSSEPARLLEEFRCGTRVDPGDSTALAKAIVEMTEGPLEEMGSRALQAFRENFERSVVTARFEAVLRTVSASPATLSRREC